MHASIHSVYGLGFGFRTWADLKFPSMHALGTLSHAAHRAGAAIHTHTHIIMIYTKSVCFRNQHVSFDILLSAYYSLKRDPT
jgi:hypothetical protein